MKKLTILLLVMFSISLIAQKDNSKRHEKREARFRELEKIKLLEVLDLDEETSVRFFVRKKKYEDEFRNYLDELKILYNNLETALEEGSSEDKLNSLVKKIIDSDIEMVKHKNNFFQSLDDILTPEQIARAILFERKFKKDIRDLLIERGRKKYFRNKSHK